MWLPKELTEAALDKIVFGYQLAAFSSVYDTFLEVLRAHKAWVEARHKLVDEHHSNQGTSYSRTAVESAAFPVLPKVKSDLITLLNTIAQIACVDGATLIDEYFTPMTFGGRLQAQQWDGPMRFGPMPGFSSYEDIARTRFGMRHNSAIDFVGAVPGSIAFVLSQDGPVRAITRRQDIVFIWPDCLSTAFID